MNVEPRAERSLDGLRLTMGAEVVLVDSGVGNLGNLRRALAHAGGNVTVSDDPARIGSSNCLVLPGVGAFRPPRERLRGALEAALRRALARGAWLLGVCVGFQLLFEGSDEFGPTDGLRLLGGRVTRLPAGVPLPHVGWNRLRFRRPGDPLLAGIDDGAYVYFVHSFAPSAVAAGDVLATCRHGVDFPALAGRGRVLGAQFHPEKSGAVGLRLLANFLALAEGERRGTAARD
jgi:glutamine amidotransferase